MGLGSDETFHTGWTTTQKRRGLYARSLKGPIGTLGLLGGKRVEQELARTLPDWVREIRFETGNDSNGDPAVWIRGKIDDEAATGDVLSKNTRQARSLLREYVRQLEIPNWPYIRFRSSSERAEATLEAVK